MLLATSATALPNDPETGAPQQPEPGSTRPVKFDGGGGVPTASDNLRFASLLPNDVEFGGHRVLSPVTTGTMLTNQPGPQVRNPIGNADPTRANDGSGLGPALRTTSGIVPLLGSVGDFSWPGASGSN